MITIKVIYQKKVHKLPPTVTKYQDIITTIKKIYPNLQQFYLFTLLNPNFGQEGIGEINCELSLQFLKNMYQQIHWTTIRLLVSEHQNIDKIYSESWQQMNQSEFVLSNSKFEMPRSIIVEKVVEVQRMVEAQQQPKKVNFDENQALKEQVWKLVDDRLRKYNLILSEELENKISELQNIYANKDRAELKKIVLDCRELTVENIAAMMLDQ